KPFAKTLLPPPESSRHLSPNRCCLLLAPPLPKTLLPPRATASPARLHHISGIGTAGIGAASPLVTTLALDLGGSKDPKKRVADMPPGGIKPRYKRAKFDINTSDEEGNYSDEEPGALDLFKECHYSKKKKGFTPTVQLAITEMESKIYTSTEGEESISTTQAVADVLAQKTKKNQFLLNVGLQNLCSRNTVENTEAQLEAEKMAKNELLKQVEVLSKQVEETEHARIWDQEETRKKQTDLEAKLQLVLSQIQPS
ncbi:hypothetical protein E2562_035037, partial [Oryza meyeriana var. granulata]